MLGLEMFEEYIIINILSCLLDYELNKEKIGFPIVFFV